MLRHSLLRAVAIVLCFGLGACSIHPIPKDVTGYKTATIVRKIRCEARDAVIQAGLNYLQRKGLYPEVADAAALEALLTHQQIITLFSKLNYLPRTGIVYSFSLEGTETNGLTFTSDVIKPLTHGTETFSPSLGNTLKRDNIRAFTVSDSFSSLINLEAGHCKFNSEISGPNYEYPIVGRIGVDEMIKTFVELAVSGELGVSQDPAKTISLTPAGLPTMVDTITFTTTITAGLTPKIVLSPVGTALQLMDASLAGSVGRVDTHQVIIGLALGPKPAAAAPHVATTPGPKLTSLFITTSPKDPGSGEELAAQAVAQQILRFETRRSLIAAP